MNKKALYEKIMSNIAYEVKRALNENDEFVDKIHYDMLLSGLKNYGELTHEDIYSIFNDNLYDTDGRELDSLRADGDKIYHAYRTPNGTFEHEFYIRDFTDEQLEQIYDFLNDNRDPNIEFFKQLPDNNKSDDSILDSALNKIDEIRRLFINLSDFYINDGDELEPEIQQIADQYKYYDYIDTLLYVIKDRYYLNNEDETRNAILGIIKKETENNGEDNVCIENVLEDIYDVVKDW